MDYKKLSLKSFFDLCEMLPTLKSVDELPKHVLREKSLPDFAEQIREEEFYKKKRDAGKSIYQESDSDEELKLQLKNAVRKYKGNRREKSPAKNVPCLDAQTFRNNSEVTNDNSNTMEYKSRRPVEILKSEKSKANLNCQIGNNGSAVSDIQQLINFFFLKKIDQPVLNETKNYSYYEKQWAIPKSFFWTHSDENAVDLDKIVKLSERTCSKPFFYIVPENPSPNFLFPPGSYYVIPKEPDSSSDEKIVLHPEATAKFTTNISEDFEVKDLQGNFIENSKILSMNDLGKEVSQKMDSHLNIGPKDVKHNDSLNNFEANYKPFKSYDKSVMRASSCEEENEILETSTGVMEGLEESVSEKIATIQPEEAEENKALNGDLEELSEAQQILMSEFPDLDPFTALNIANKINTESGGLQDFITSKCLENKIEAFPEILRMLLDLPESSTEELRSIYNQFQGNEDRVTKFIEKVKSDATKRQNVLEMQFIFPDADPDYLYNEIEKLGDDENAINLLTDRMLDEKNYPKIVNIYMDEERRRLWQMYVENFNVEDYIRNAPKPENLEHETESSNYAKLALDFLQSRYPEVDLDVLQRTFNSCGMSLIRTCGSKTLSNYLPVGLANSSFKNKDFNEAFLKLICYVDKKEEIDKYLTEIKEKREAEIEEARLNSMFLGCPLCYNDEVVASDAVACPEGHLFCKDCIRRYIFVKLGDGLCKFLCPSDDCEALLPQATLEKLLPDKMLTSIVKKQQLVEISAAKVEGLETCPYCEFACIPNSEDKIFKCQNQACLIETCRNCREKNHIPLRCEEVERSQDLEARKKIEEAMSEKLIRICPKCSKKFVKEDGCNKVVCTCGTIVCYYCTMTIDGYDHFQRTGSESWKCPTYSQNSQLHVTDVIAAGVAARNRILRENPSVRILHDPTTHG